MGSPLGLLEHVFRRLDVSIAAPVRHARPAISGAGGIGDAAPPRYRC